MVKYNLGDEVTVLIKGTVTGLNSLTGQPCQICDSGACYRSVYDGEEVTLVKPKLDEKSLYIDEKGTVWSYGYYGSWYRIRNGKSAHYSEKPDYATFRKLVPEIP